MKLFALFFILSFLIPVYTHGVSLTNEQFELLRKDIRLEHQKHFEILREDGRLHREILQKQFTSVNNTTIFHNIAAGVGMLAAAVGLILIAVKG